MKKGWKKATALTLSILVAAINAGSSLQCKNTFFAEAAEQVSAGDTDSKAITSISTDIAESVSDQTNTAVLVTAAPQSEDLSYFDEETATLHLKGLVRNNINDSYSGIALPEGVDPAAVKHLVADEGTVLPADCSWLIRPLENVETVDMKNADSSNVSDMSYMFAYYWENWFWFEFEDGYGIHVQLGLDPKLKSIDLTGFDTSKAMYMQGMFYNQAELESLDLTGFDTGNVTDMSRMFLYCSINSLDLSGFDTSNVTDMSEMFMFSGLDELDLSSFDTSNTTNMFRMFKYTELNKIDLSSFDTRNVTDMCEMFDNCYVDLLDLSSFDTNNVKDMSYMFYSCPVETIIVGDGWSTDSITDYHGNKMFYHCGNLKGGEGTVYDEENTDYRYARIDGGYDNNRGYLSSMAQYLDESYMDEKGILHLKGHIRKDAYGLHVSPDMSYYDGIIVDEGAVFPDDCSYLFSLGEDSIRFVDLSKADTSNVTNMRYMFDGLVVDDLDLSSFDTSNVTDMSGMFYDYRYDDSLDLSGFDTSKVTDMSNMFAGCYSLKSLDLSSFDTSNVTNMSGMFSMDNEFWPNFDSELKELDLSSFDTSNVTDMSYMFYNCDNLTELDLSNFNTSNVTDMSSMFNYCTNLTSLDISGFDTGNAESMNKMFAYCNRLKALDLSSFDTSKVKDMSEMFIRCVSLKNLDLSSFDTSSVADMYGMFAYCKSLKTITVSDKWTTESATGRSMFNGDTYLRGGAGTAYNSSRTGIEYARIDGGKKAPGYFTKAKAEIKGSDIVTIINDIPFTELNKIITELGSIVNTTEFSDITAAAIDHINNIPSSDYSQLADFFKIVFAGNQIKL